MERNVKEAEILQKLGIEPSTHENFRIFTAALKTILKYDGQEDLESLGTRSIPVLSNLERLNHGEIEFVDSELQKADTSIDVCQVQVQKLIPEGYRKMFAAFYTIDVGIRFMASLALKYLEHFEKGRIVLADPFLGSGRTLTAAIQEIGSVKLRRVWGIEPLPLPALVAYASLLDATDGMKGIITVVSGDAFREIPQALSSLTRSELPKADVILTNPPFTRWKHLEESYRDHLLKLVSELGYGEYVTRREAGLQTLSMLLSDYVLKDDGLIASVLPASTFYTMYGVGYKALLRKNYRVLGVLECASRPSFSEDSGFKEVIMAAIKRAGGEGQTVFTELNGNAEEIAEVVMNERKPNYRVNLFDIRDLPRFLDINWLALFGENRLRDIVVSIFEQGLSNGTLEYWDNVLGKKKIVRGVEMYGPEFFFIPNKLWCILNENDRSVEIENIQDKTRLTLSKEFLIGTLRKPSLYSRVIEVKVDSYMLSIPQMEQDDLPRDLQHYVKWGADSGTAKPALRAYGRYWYTHVHKQMMTKRPFGQVFIPDKVDLMFRRRSVFVNYSKEKKAASKNFYVVKEGSETISKLLIGWFNSTIFVSTLVLLGRKISETWTRFLENDYIQLPVINAASVDKNNILEACMNLEEILNESLPPLWDQLNKGYRYQLDLSLAKAIGVGNPEKIVGQLHQVLLDRFFSKVHISELAT